MVIREKYSLPLKICKNIMNFFFENFSITVIDQRLKFGVILALTFIQLSNGLDGGLWFVGPTVKEKK